MPLIILASRSPRRRQLLAEAGYSFRVHPPRSADESPLKDHESPAEFVMRLAEEKASDVAAQLTDHDITPAPSESCGNAAAAFTPVSRLPSPDSAAALVLGCDTIAHCDGQILGKPESADHAREMLRTLRGRDHEVLTGVCLIRLPDGRRATRVAETRLRMDRLSDETITEYIESGQWQGKAGGFGFQDRLGWVHVVDGSPSNVVGLPLELLATMLKEL